MSLVGDKSVRMKGGQLDRFRVILLVTLPLWLVLLSPPHLVSGEPLLFEAGAIWMNNASADGFVPMRIMSSDSTVFSFGFVGSSSSGFYLSVFFSTMPNVENGTVWSANRNNPVQIGATLRAGADNNVALVDTNGTIVWFTQLDAFQVTGFELRNTGNLALINGTNSTLWQSFDYPTDTLVLNQSLAAGGRIVSRTAPSDLREGAFSLRTVEGGIVLEALLSDQDNSSAVYWGWGLDSGNPDFVGLRTSCPYAVSASVDPDGFRVSATDTAPEPCGSVITKAYQGAPSTTGPPQFALLRLGQDGNVHVYSVDIVMTDAFVLGRTLLSLITDGGCHLPSSCGLNAVCEESGSGRTCSCPDPAGQPSEAFTGLSAGGCAPPRELDASECGKKEMAALGAGFEYLPFQSFAGGVAAGDGDSCQKMCLGNCSCVAAFYQEEGGVCYTVAHTLYSMQHVTRSGGIHTAYLKVQSSEGLAMGRTKLSWWHLPLLLGSAVLLQSWVGVCV